MVDLSDFPKSFAKLLDQPPEGFFLSERIIDPLIVFGINNNKTVARLAGYRVNKGKRDICYCPSNQHTWAIDGNTIRPLPKDAADLYREILGPVDLDEIPYSTAVQILRNKNLPIEALPDENFFLAGQALAETFEEGVSIPGLLAELFPYQARGVQWMSETINRTGGLILADEMGLGKTIQIIALLLIDPPQPTSPALIVCPTSLIANWVREIEKFSTGLSVLVHRGPQRAGIYKDLQKTNVVITTYDTMVNDISIFSSFEWSWVICDEAQAIKTPGSNRRQAVATIPRKRSIPMTGTPVENSLIDLWSLIDFAIPGLLGSLSEFETEYPDSMESAKAVGFYTDPVILKRRVAEVAGDLPDRIDIDIPIDMDEQLITHYLEVRESTLAKYPVAGALVATLQLQLVCAHPWLRRQDDGDQDAEEAKIVRTKGYPLITQKMERAVALIQEAFFNNRKVIVFALFNRIGDLIQESIPKNPDTYWGAINGSTPQNMRQQIIDDFTAHVGPGCLILNPKAAGAGLNITTATVVIHFTPVWNPALEAQASARAHRRGQTQPVTVYRLFYKNTVEEVMLERSLWKSELANESVPVSSRNEGDLARALQIMPKSL